MKQYNNDLTPEILASLQEPAFTPEQIAEMPEDARKIVMEHPLPLGTQITSTTTPVPEEKSFADYILILSVVC